MEFSTNAGKYTACLTDVQSSSMTFEVFDQHDEEVIARGSIRSDGCSNWDMMPDEVMLHFCDPRDMKDFHVVCLTCYDHAKGHFDVNNVW